MLKRMFATSCRTTPVSIGFWAITFLVLYTMGQALRGAAVPLAPFGDTISLASLSAACFLNFRCYRSLHCGLTGPLFLCAAVAAALVEAKVWSFDERLIWAVVLPAAALALVLEWRLARR